MATGIDARIAQLLINHAVTMTFAQQVEFAVPAVAYVPTLGVPYIRLDYIPNETETISLSDSQFKYLGLLQATICWPNGEGLRKPLDSIDVIQKHFDKGTRLQDAELLVRITKRPTVSGPIIDGDRSLFPVTVRYESFNQ